MRKILFSCLCCIWIHSSIGQSVPPSSIKDSMIGWIKVYNFKGAVKPMNVDAKSYSINQLSLCDSFANWMQASYIPKGGLGGIKRFVSQKLGEYNQNTAALPQGYGASATTYAFLKYNSKHKLEPENNLGVSWVITANGVPGWEVRDVSSPEAYYFTMPSFEISHDPEPIKKVYDLSEIPNLKPYIKFWIKNIEAGNGTNYVLLSEGNRSPFIKLSKGEYLQLLEKAIPRFREKEMRIIREKYTSNQRDIDYFSKYLEERLNRFTVGLQKNRERYKDKLAETALVNAQPGLGDLENERDIFSNGYLSDPENTSGRVPIYKVDPAKAELCKKDQPQWILVSWWWSPHDSVEKHMHESIINNFNFNYVYNFFFDPQKVKGQPYKPILSSRFQKED